MTFGLRPPRVCAIALAVATEAEVRKVRRETMATMVSHRPAGIRAASRAAGVAGRGCDRLPSTPIVPLFPVVLHVGVPWQSQAVCFVLQPGRLFPVHRIAQRNQIVSSNFFGRKNRRT